MSDTQPPEKLRQKEEEPDDRTLLRRLARENRDTLTDDALILYIRLAHKRGLEVPR